MIGPLGYLFALCALVLVVALYRTRAASARMEAAYRSRVTALQDEVRLLRPSALQYHKEALQRDIAAQEARRQALDDFAKAFDQRFRVSPGSSAK